MSSTSLIGENLKPWANLNINSVNLNNISPLLFPLIFQNPNSSDFNTAIAADPPQTGFAFFKFPDPGNSNINYIQYTTSPPPLVPPVNYYQVTLNNNTPQPIFIQNTLVSTAYGISVDAEINNITDSTSASIKWFGYNMRQGSTLATLPVAKNFEQMSISGDSSLLSIINGLLNYSLSSGQFRFTATGVNGKIIKCIFAVKILAI